METLSLDGLLQQARNIIQNVELTVGESVTNEALLWGFDSGELPDPWTYAILCDLRDRLKQVGIVLEISRETRKITKPYKAMYDTIVSKTVERYIATLRKTA